MNPPFVYRAPLVAEPTPAQWRAAGHMRALAIWNHVAGWQSLFSVLSCGIMLWGGAPILEWLDAQEFVHIVAFHLFCYGFHAAVSVTVGFGLWGFHGWARWVAIVGFSISALMMLVQIVLWDLPWSFGVPMLLWCGAQVFATAHPSAATVLSPAFRSARRHRPMRAEHVLRSPYAWLAPAIGFGAFMLSYAAGTVTGRLI